MLEAGTKRPATYASTLLMENSHKRQATTQEGFLNPEANRDIFKKLRMLLMEHRHEPQATTQEGFLNPEANRDIFKKLQYGLSQVPRSTTSAGRNKLNDSEEYAIDTMPEYQRGIDEYEICREDIARIALWNLFGDKLRDCTPEDLLKENFLHLGNVDNNTRMNILQEYYNIEIKFHRSETIDNVYHEREHALQALNIMLSNGKRKEELTAEQKRHWSSINGFLFRAGMMEDAYFDSLKKRSYVDILAEKTLMISIRRLYDHTNIQEKVGCDNRLICPSVYIRPRTKPSWGEGKRWRPKTRLSKLGLQK